MMTVRLGLLRVFWRQALPATLCGGCSLGLYAFFWPDVMTPRDVWPGLMVLGQCLLLAALLGRFRSPAFAFAYSRGYSREALWGHMMLASALSVLVGLLPACAIVWAGLRSMVRDHVFQSPYFPIMAPRETCVPLVWLALGILLTAACHYAWIRRAQPTKCAQGGNSVAAGLIIALVVAFVEVRSLHGWFAWLSGGVYVATVACLLWGGMRLNRSLEVRT